MGVKVREKLKGSGEWWVFINHKGKRRSKKVGDKRAANAVKREVEARLAKGDLKMIREQCPTVASYGADWLESPFQVWKESTHDNYSGAFDIHIEPSLGSKRLDEVKRADIKRFIAALRSDNLSSARIQTIMGVLSGIFTSAIEDEILAANPCSRTGKYAGNGRGKEINPLTPAEVSTLLEKASQNLSDMLYTLFLLLARTGLRIGEALALEWSDIDFEERTAEITKNWDYIRRKITAPKNNKPRKVDLSLNVVEALKRLRATRKVVKLTGAIFTGKRGERLVYKPVYKALQKVAPRPMRIHDLRHTYATLRVAKGDNIVDVSNQLGHHDPGFSLKKYAHWLPGEHKSQVDELDKIAPIRTLSAP